MKKIVTEMIIVPLGSKINLDNIFNQTERILKKADKKPLRLILIDIKEKKAKILASFVYEK